MEQYPYIYLPTPFEMPPLCPCIIDINFPICYCGGTGEPLEPLFPNPKDTIQVPMLADGLQHLPMSPVLSLDSSDTDNAPSEQINDPAADEWRYAANDFAVSTIGTSMENTETTNDLFTVSEYPKENAVGTTDESSPAAKIEVGHRSHNPRMGIATQLDEDIYQDSSRRYGCVKCKKTFGRRQEAKRHATNSLSCGGTRAFRCHKCKRLFTRQDALARHVKGSDGMPPACKNP